MNTYFSASLSNFLDTQLVAISDLLIGEFDAEFAQFDSEPTQFEHIVKYKLASIDDVYAGLFYTPLLSIVFKNVSLRTHELDDVFVTEPEAPSFEILWENTTNFLLLWTTTNTSYDKVLRSQQIFVL